MMWQEPIDNTMQDRLEDKLIELLLADVRLEPLAVIYRGEPGAVPTKLHPFGAVFLELETDANQDGYGSSTGVRNYRYSGYVSIDVLMKDARGLLPGASRRVDVPSYRESKRYIQVARQAIMAWGGPFGELEENPVVSSDTKERSVEMITSNLRNGLASRDDNNYTNRGSFEFSIMTTRQMF